MKQQQFRRSARPIPHAANRAVVESLESRQLLSAQVDLRLVGGGDSVTVTSVGQTINFEVWLRVEGDDGIDNEGAQILSGGFLSTNVSGGAALGNLTLTRDAAFSSLGSSDGVQTDVDSDGDLDVGGTDDTVAEGFFAARSPGMTTDGVRDGQAEEFKVGTGSFTVTSLLNGVTTELTFKIRQGVPTSWLVQEDGANSNGTTGATLEIGDTITLRREGTASISGRVFDDKNATGFFDGDDTGVSGFRVFLDEDLDGVLDADELSKPVSATGTYTFSNVVAGTYRVTQVVRDDWRTSFPGEGYYHLTIGYGQVGKSLSFANTQGVLIKGFVWHDSDADRARDPIEDPLAGWRVIIDLNENGIWDAGDVSKATNSRGAFRFSLLTNGTFTVMARQIEGYRQTTNGGFPRVITLGPGDTTSNKNFGFKRLK